MYAKLVRQDNVSTVAPYLLQTLFIDIPQIKKRKRDVARRAASTQDANDGAAADDAGYPSSGDEDESASQEFRMEDEHGRG